MATESARISHAEALDLLLDAESNVHSFTESSSSEQNVRAASFEPVADFGTQAVRFANFGSPEPVETRSCSTTTPPPRRIIQCDVFIAGSGPIGCTYAREILEKCDSSVLRPRNAVYMAEIGAQESPVVGAHLKNAVKYQKDIDAFVHVIQGALQPVSIPVSDTHQSTLGGNSWTPPINSKQNQLVICGQNPQQSREDNLGATAVTRAVGGMATHWTCACPTPHSEETTSSPIPRNELDSLLARARDFVKVDSTVFDKSIRHTTVKDILTTSFPNRNIRSIPLAVQPHSKAESGFVTWSGSDTVLGDIINDPRFTIASEHRVTQLIVHPSFPGTVAGVLMRDLKTDRDVLVHARAYVIACGAVCTPQILYNSDIRPPALGRYLTEQSMAFCQIVLSKKTIQNIQNTQNPAWQALIAQHRKKHPLDPLPIPFRDLDPQVMIPYSSAFPWHAQIHRDAFSYGDVGPRSDPRVVVDLRFFGKGDILENNRVEFSNKAKPEERPEHTDVYGMPQATFHVVRTDEDRDRDQKMMNDMTTVANSLGGYLPGSEPQFMEPGLAMHITGTTRIGSDSKTSVANPCSKVWGFSNLWVGGNNVIPDSTASNPTLTSMAYALKGASDVIQCLQYEYQ
ncbi:pyranose 2-oxidase [Lentinula edodes]|uniref:pyranose 2-oxidase n=1 Tax=Lentinula edodes TaxID=5353 RepID=UPI001E8E988B|nr:pyranose 2-oxidase [Lentinula edodes]KAH7871076.1 pyranose 2-oxidase [Lentinula edodes]